VDRRARAACRERIERLRPPAGINVTVSVPGPGMDATVQVVATIPSGLLRAVGNGLATSASPSQRAGSGRRGPGPSARTQDRTARRFLVPC